MCVKETFPPRPRFRWLLITVRLSIINFAGIARTDVAVGTESDASMLCTTRALTPRIGSSAAAPGVTSVGIGFTIGSAGVGALVALTVDALTGGCDEVVTVIGTFFGVVGAGVTCGAAGRTGDALTCGADADSEGVTPDSADADSEGVTPDSADAGAGEEETKCVN